MQNEGSIEPDDRQDLFSRLVLARARCEAGANTLAGFLQLQDLECNAEASRLAVVRAEVGKERLRHTQLQTQLSIIGSKLSS